MPTLHPKDVHTELGKAILVDGFDFVYDVSKSHGSYIHDALTGREYLDLFTFFASAPIGHNHPRLLNAENQAALARVATGKPSNSDVFTVEYAEFVKTFREKAMPKGFRYAFFVEGGSVAVENALKVAFDYKVRRNFAKGATREVGTKIAHFRHAFHGRTGYSLSLTNTLPDKIAYFPKFDWPRFDAPALRFPLDAQAERDVEQTERRILSQIRWHGEHEGDDIAAIIIEPIQAEGGDRHFRQDFFQGLRELCDTYDWLLIFDEVQTGFGITGKMWAFEHFGVEPDIICFGKKAQVCGIIARETIDRVPDNVFHVPSRINSTWGGNLTDMVRCRMYLDVMSDEGLVENAARQGKRLLDGITALANKYPNKITNARGRGLLCSFSFKVPDERKIFLTNLVERGAIMLPCGNDSVRFRPPLSISTQEVDAALTMVASALAALT